jgi:hypothetical protein
MSQYAIAVSLFVFAVVAWDVSRRFFALQLRKLTENERLTGIEERAAADFADLKMTTELARRDLETKYDKALVAIRRDVQTLDENATELDGKMSRLVTQKTQQPRSMTLGGIRR